MDPRRVRLRRRRVGAPVNRVGHTLSGVAAGLWTLTVEDEHGNRFPCHADVLLALANGDQ